MARDLAGNVFPVSESVILQAARKHDRQHKGHEDQHPEQRAVPYFVKQRVHGVACSPSEPNGEYGRSQETTVKQKIVVASAFAHRGPDVLTPICEHSDVATASTFTTCWLQTR